MYVMGTQKYKNRMLLRFKNSDYLIHLDVRQGVQIRYSVKQFKSASVAIRLMYTLAALLLVCASCALIAVSMVVITSSNELGTQSILPFKIMFGSMAIIMLVISVAHLPSVLWMLKNITSPRK